MAPVVRRRNTLSDELRFPWSVVSVPPRHFAPSRRWKLFGQSRDRGRAHSPIHHGPRSWSTGLRLRSCWPGLRMTTEDAQCGRNSHCVWQTKLLEGCPKRGDVAIASVGGNSMDLQLGRLDASQQTQRHSPFLAKLDSRRDASLLSSLRSVPSIGQIKVRAHQPGAFAIPQSSRDGDLTVADLAQRSRVLARHPHGFLSLFGETRIVENQDALTFRKDGQELTPHRRCFPRRMGHEVLEGLIGSRVQQTRVHRLHRLAGAVVQQPIYVVFQANFLSSVSETNLEPVDPTGQPTKNAPRSLVQHRHEE